MNRCEIETVRAAIAGFNATAYEAAECWLEHVLEIYQSANSEPVLYCHVGSWMESCLVMPDDADVVLIIGDVFCERYLDDRALSENSLLVITGNVQAAALISCAACVIGGNAALDYVYAASGNNFQLVVGGDLSVGQAIIENGQNIVCAGDIKAPFIVSNHNEITANQIICPRYLEGGANDSDVFIDELLQSTTSLEWNGVTWLPADKPFLALMDEPLIERICAGLPVLR
jgi:hypothetical protein